MNTPINPDLGKATVAAREALVRALGQDEINVTLTETASIRTTGEQLLRVTAIVPGRSNAPRQVVVDGTGEVRDLPDLEAAVGRRLFVPSIGAVPGRPAALRERVTIDPASNELTLPNCKREPEQITVTVPKSGV